MRKLLLIPAFMFLTLACEDEKEKASNAANCATVLAEMLSVAPPAWVARDPLNGHSSGVLRKGCEPLHCAQRCSAVRALLWRPRVSVWAGEGERLVANASRSAQCVIS